MTLHLGVEAIRRGRPAPKEKRHAVEPPTPRVPARPLAPAAIEHKEFPRAPRAAYRLATQIPGAQVAMTFAVGPYMARDFQSILEHNMPSLALWVVRPDRRRLYAWWINRGSWTFENAWCSPPYETLNTKGMTAWLGTR